MKIDDFEFEPDQVENILITDYDSTVKIVMKDGRQHAVTRLTSETEPRQTWNRVVDAITTSKLELRS